MVIWITGRSNAGKTTLANLLSESEGGIVLDGDDVRHYFPIGYDERGICKNHLTITNIARILEKQGYLVIIAIVSRNRAQRKYFQSYFDECVEICMPGGTMWKGTEYEEPQDGESIVWREDWMVKCSTCQGLYPYHEIDRIDIRGLRNRTGYAYCKTCQNNKRKVIYRRNKLRAIEYLGGSCIKCNLIFPIEVYDFHHRDPLGGAQKKRVGELLHLSWNRIKTELDKCDLYCANCHRIKHRGGI